MDNVQLFGFFVVMGIATFITRALLWHLRSEGHSILDRFGKSLPPTLWWFWCALIDGLEIDSVDRGGLSALALLS